MSENLIYGADILGYGAAGDGKTDCSDAFSKAIENGENLISFPFGTYLFTKPVILGSNIKLHFHANANIIFAPEKDADYFIFAQDSASVEICGGLFNVKDGIKCDVFSFVNCENIRISGCTVNAPTGKGSVVFDCCSDAVVSNVTFNGMSDAVVILGECEKLTVKGCNIKSAANVIQCGRQSKPCNVKRLDIRSISVCFCDSFIEFLCGSADEISAENINARLSFAFMKLFADFSLGDALFENLELYIIDRVSGDGKNPVYFSLASAPASLEVRGFKRLVEFESAPAVPTLIFKNTNSEKAKFIIDAMTLDNVIAARGKSKTVGMTTAKLTNPVGKFIYTLEVSVENNDSFTIPYGDFEYLTLYGN